MFFEERMEMLEDDPLFPKLLQSLPSLRFYVEILVLLEKTRKSSIYSVKSRLDHLILLSKAKLFFFFKRDV